LLARLLLLYTRCSSVTAGRSRARLTTVIPQCSCPLLQLHLPLPRAHHPFMIIHSSLIIFLDCVMTPTPRLMTTATRTYPLPLQGSPTSTIAMPPAIALPQRRRNGLREATPLRHAMLDRPKSPPTPTVQIMTQSSFRARTALSALHDAGPSVRIRLRRDIPCPPHASAGVSGLVAPLPAKLQPMPTSHSLPCHPLKPPLLYYSTLTLLSFKTAATPTRLWALDLCPIIIALGALASLPDV
jgi:hypothetical protein